MRTTTLIFQFCSCYFRIHIPSNPRPILDFGSWLCGCQTYDIKRLWVFQPQLMWWNETIKGFETKIIPWGNLCPNFLFPYNLRCFFYWATYACVHKSLWFFSLLTNEYLNTVLINSENFVKQYPMKNWCKVVVVILWVIIL